MTLALPTPAFDLSCRDWEQRMREGKILVPDLPFPNPSEGARAVRIFNNLRLFDVPGTPKLAEAGADWFRAVVFALFASLDPVTKARMIRELFLLVPKKNMKTTGGALLMLTALLMNARPRAPMLLTGPVQKTADDAFAAIHGAIELDDVLAKKLHVRDHIKTIVHRETKAKLEIMTFDPEVVTGKKVVYGLIDEEHVLGKMPRASKAMVQLRGGMVPFPEAFLAIITTQSDEAPAGVFRDDLKKARDIRDGKRAGKTLPVLYEFPEAMQKDPAKPWLRRENWPMVTPNAGLSISLDTLEEDCFDAQEKGEAELRLWASQHLNVEIGLALQSDRWAGADYWEANGDKDLTLEQLIERSDVIVACADGGGLDDLLALSFVGREKATGEWLSWSHAWAHPSVLERRKSEASRLMDFVADGDLTIVERIGQDAEQVADYVEKVEKTGLLDRIGVDPNVIGPICDAIVKRKIEHERIVPVPQGWRMVGAIISAERRLAEGALHHGARPLMAWAVGNVKIEQRGSALIMTKQAAGRAKIDPVISLLNGVTLMAMNPKPRRRQYQVFFVGQG